MAHSIHSATRPEWQECRALRKQMAKASGTSAWIHSLHFGRCLANPSKAPFQEPTDCSRPKGQMAAHARAKQGPDVFGRDYPSRYNRRSNPVFAGQADWTSQESKWGECLPLSARARI